jgi:hypothetical protein
MSGWFAVPRFNRRAPLAFGLCLLAFLFAIEAKTAWYGPAAGFGGNVRAAKAQPVTSPEVVEHGVTSPARANPVVAFFAFPLISIAMILGIPAWKRGNVLPGIFFDFPDRGFSISNLFRPPPTL